MKMSIEQLQEEQQRNAAEAKANYWYPGEFNGVRQWQWLEAVLLDITLMERRHVGETQTRRLRPDIVLAPRIPKFVTVEAASTPRAWEDPRWQFQGICIAYLSFSLLRRRKSGSKKSNDLS